jgi:hypothetical protein
VPKCIAEIGGRLRRNHIPISSDYASLNEKSAAYFPNSMTADDHALDSLVEQ